MDLDALAIFHLVASHGGFGRAARATGRSKATLSRRVAGLERSLGLRLLERSAGPFRLTEDGRSLLAGTRGALDELSAAEGALREGAAEPHGKLRVNVPLLLASRMMGELSARFLQHYPSVRLEITAEDRYVDLVGEGFDVAVRASPPADDELVGRCVLRDRFLVVAASHLPRPIVGPGGGPAPVPAIVRSIGSDAELWPIEGPGGSLVLRPNPVLRLSTLAIRDAVLAGAGAALLPSFHVRDDLAAGRMACWGSLARRELEVWALHASARLTSGKVRAFMQFLAEAFAQGEPAVPATSGR